MSSKNIVIGWVGSEKDKGADVRRWKKWRPSVSLFQHGDFSIDRCELLYQTQSEDLMKIVTADIKEVSPKTSVRPQLIHFNEPWDFPEVYRILYKFVSEYEFDCERENYFLHLTTGTHVSQICMFLLAESKIFPGKLIQTSPINKPTKEKSGRYEIVDLGHDDFNRIRSRIFLEEQSKTNISHLKDNIDTKNNEFNTLIKKIERIAVQSIEPILLLGPTGAGKTKLARLIYDLKVFNKKVSGDFIKVNCATIKGDGAMSALFGHIKGSFTGALQKRRGLLLSAHKGILFLDEIAELGSGEQAMLLHALEEKQFLPYGADKQENSDFQLIAGTNANLYELVEQKLFREDLLARLEHWKFVLPGLKNRREDIEPNIDFELQQLTNRRKQAVSFTPNAKNKFIEFAVSPVAIWQRNFRDLSRAIDRMATLSPNGRITTNIVEREIIELQESWVTPSSIQQKKQAEKLLTEEQLNSIDDFKLIQLEAVLAVCCKCRTIAEAARQLFPKSLMLKKSKNDSDRLRKYLLTFEIEWSHIQILK
ncbi:MAG: RNA repair transcriptional activator RtcR [Pyrinomonadaceae bacterium]